MQNTSLVCCRFEENIDWIRDLPSQLPIYLYNKGDKLNLEKHDNIQQYHRIANMGRESEVYLRFIYDNYDNLSDTVIFTQADPFVHHTEFLYLINNLDETHKEYKIIPLTYRWNDKLPPSHIVSEYSDSFYLQNMSRFTLAPINFIDEGIQRYCLKYLIHHPELKMGDDLIKHFCNLIGLQDDGSDHKFFYSSCFSVRKDAILQHTKQFYLNCYVRLSDNPFYGHMFERVWYKMFL
jgi:hypothetical protein